MSKERQSPLLGRPLRPVFATIAVIILGIAVFASSSMPASARVFFVSIVDSAEPGFKDGDFDLSDAQIFPLTVSDGMPGNSGFQIDTWFAPVGSTVWIGVAAEEGAGPLWIDSNDYGTFTNALCNDNNGDTQDFKDPSDRCLNMVGVGTDELQIPDDNNSIEHQPPGILPRMGVAIAFKCDANSGVAHITAGQDGVTFDFFVVCHGPLATSQFSATATRLEIWPQFGSTAHSLIRLQLFDASGGVVAGYEVEFSIDRCAIETESVNLVEEALDVLHGQVALIDTEDPDSTPQTDFMRNLVYDFDGDGRLESLALAVVHCEPGHSPTNTPGPITIKAHISKSGEASRDITFTINLIGPPAQIFLQAAPTRVICGEKVTVNATVVDALGQPVSDHTPIEFVVNLGGTGTAARLLGPVAPISSGVGRTLGGVAQFFLLTSNANTGNYDIVAQSEGIFSTPPVVQTTSISCTRAPTPTAAPATVVPTVAAGIGIRPPNTGDAGLR